MSKPADENKGEGSKILDAALKHAISLNFGFKSEKLGRLLIGILSTNALCELEDKVLNLNDIDSKELAIKLFSIITKKFEKDGLDEQIETSLNESDLNQLSDEGLLEIAKIFIDIQFQLDEKEFYVEKSIEEDHLQHLKNLLIKQRQHFSETAKTFREKFKGLTEGFSKAFKPSAFQDLLSKTTNRLYKENLDLSARLGKSLESPIHSIVHEMKVSPRPHLPNITPLINPVHESNELLEKIEAHLNKLNDVNDNASSLIKNLNDLGVGMAKDITEGNEQNAKHSKWMLLIALFTLFCRVDSTSKCNS